MRAPHPRHGIVSTALLLLLAVCLAAAQSPQAPPSQAVTGRHFEVPRRGVINFLDLAAQEKARPPQPVERVVAPYMSTPGNLPVPFEALGGAVEAPQLPPGPPPVPLSPDPSPLLADSFEALGDDGTHIPPDTTGAVGPNHLMVTLNSEVRIQNRSGFELSRVTLGSFWASTMGTGTFDPKIVYDALSNRWVFVTLSDRRSADSSLLIGVTQTADPTGMWNLYRIDADGTDTNWADFPSLGFNKDWIVVTLNMFANADDAFAGGRILAFDKSKLYAGMAAAFTTFDDMIGGTLAPARTYDASLDREYLIKDFNGNAEVMPGVFRGAIRVGKIQGPVGSETYTDNITFILVTGTWGFDNGTGDDFAPQKDTADLIQTNDSRMCNVIFRNGSLWATQAAFLPADAPTRSAVQWWEIARTAPDTLAVQQFGRVDDSMGNIFYAFPSIAVNSRSDVMLGYASFAADRFAGGSYSFRLAGDPANTLRDDTILKAGESVYFKDFDSGRNRWGDYSNTVVDPANDIDFWTIQEYASSPDFPSGNDRWGTWWGHIAPDSNLVSSNGSAITINDSGTPPTAASPYPSTINVSGVVGTVSRVIVRLSGFTHTFPDDVDILLVGPTGANAIILSDIGGGTSVAGLELILDDNASGPLSDAGPQTSGTFQPTNIGGGDTFPGPAPTPAGTSNLSVFNGLDPNGTWSLYVVDGFEFDSGSIDRGWALQFVLAAPAGAKKRRGQVITQ